MRSPSERRTRVLLFSTVFPNAAQPHHGVFVRERLLDDHAARRLDAGWALWTLLMLEVWGREVARAAAAPVTSDLVEVPHAVGI